MKNKKNAIGIDIGGTKTTIGVVSSKGEVLKDISFPTSQDYQEEENLIFEKCKLLIEEFDAVALGIGIAGQVDKKAASLVFSPNLPWKNIPFQKNFEKFLNIPTLVVNDVRAAAFGEWVFGAAKGKKNVLAVFIGTGVGGCIISEGNLLEGSSNTCGEIGHMVIYPGGRKCGCGELGCLEAYIGGKGLASIGKEAVAKDPKRGEKILEKAKSLEGITAKHMTEAAKENDPLAVEMIQDAENMLSHAIVSLVNILNPEIIVLGGGMCDGIPALASTIEKTVKTHALKAARESLSIKKAVPGKSSGIVGCATLSLNAFQKDL